MIGIWTNTGQGWELGSPRPFRDEATLHSLIEENPQFLPLAGAPRRAVLGSEVQLGTGYADILAFEPSGRPAVVEVKLASNPQARREIVSQVLAYAAFLQGHSVRALEQGPLRRFLQNSGHDSILEAVKALDQEGAVDDESFESSMQEFLDGGSFRLVLVLDEVPAELERVVAYLDSVTIAELTIDLIVLRVYEVNGAQVALPHRISPHIDTTVKYANPSSTRSGASKGILSDGADTFKASVETTTGAVRETFDELIVWAEGLASLPNVRLFTYQNPRVGTYTLLPRIMPDNAGLVTIYNYDQRPSMTIYRSVFERRALESIKSVERVIAPVEIGQGNTIYDITPELLDALAGAYRESAKV